MLTAIILGLLALGAFTAAMLIAWTLSALADWVFGLFENKEPDVDTNITIGDPTILDEVVEGVRKKNRSLANKLEDALNGTGSPKISIFGGGDGKFKASEVNILTAKDASVDEVRGITRFERSGVIKEY